MKNKSSLLPFAIVGILVSQSVFAVKITSSTDNALDGASVIDFDDEALSLGAVTSKTFNDDVTFSSTDGLFLADYDGLYGSSGYSFGNSGGADFDIFFEDAVSAFGFGWGAVGTTWQMTLFDVNNSVIETSYFAPPPGGASGSGFIGAAAEGISHVNMHHFSNFDYIVIDDFKYVGGGEISLPEPTGVALLGLGLAGLGFSRYRKNKA